jgi:NAD(P)H-flavin reductase
MIVNTLSNPLFNEVEVLTKTRETNDTYTFCFEFIKRQIRDKMHFVPGQYNILDIPSLGTYASIITSNPTETSTFEHTFQYNPKNPKEYQIVERLMEGMVIKVAGPFGNGWGKINLQAKNLLVVISGLGLRSVKSMLNYIAFKRYLYNSVEVLYSVKTPGDFLYMDEYDGWYNAKIDIAHSVENVHYNYHGVVKKGLIIGLLKEMKSTAEDTVVLMSGPEMMLKFSLNFLSKKQFPDRNIYISLDSMLNDTGNRWVAEKGPIFALPKLKEKSFLSLC